MSLPTLDGDNKDKNSKQSLPSIEMPPIDFDDELKKENELPDFKDLNNDEEFQNLPNDEFEELSVNKALYQDDDSNENEEIYEEVENIEDPQRELPNVSDNEKEVLEQESDYNPDYEEDLKELEKDKFIDKKKKKLIPFGGKKSKPKRFVKSSDFDDRKNKLAKTKLIQFSILLAIALIFILGLKNTFFPSHVYTDQQIRQFAAEGAGQTGFPQERGEAYVESFMNAYLSIDRTKPELFQTLSYFYGEEGFNNDNFDKLNMSWSYESKQDIIIPPKVFNVELMNEYSAQYKVSTYVSNTDGKVSDGNSTAGRWLSFSVNVYYDIEKDALIITPDSPSIIPSYRITQQVEVPERAPFGNGQVNKDILPAVTPTINGFIEAYGKASVESHESILQYIDDKSDINLYDGFGGAVELNGTPSDAINKVVYDSDDGIYRAEVTVNWKDAAATQGDHQVEYTGRYIMRIKPIGDGKYAVSSFVPYTYFK